MSPLHVTLPQHKFQIIIASQLAIRSLLYRPNDLYSWISAYNIGVLLIKL